MRVNQKTIQIGEYFAELFTIDNDFGMTVELSNWGATLIDIKTPDRDDCCQSVTLAYEDWRDYSRNESYLGATIGRAAGRIPHGQLMLGGKIFPLSQNQASHHLHGGSQSMSHQVWQVEAVEHSETEIRVVFCIRSVTTENGYPGNLDVRATYVLSRVENSLVIQYEANTDELTACNLTNHVYFNLSGNVSRTIHNHDLMVVAQAVCATDENLLVTGDIWPVAQTAFDFTKEKKIITALSAADERIKSTYGLDHYFLLTPMDVKIPAVVLFDSVSGRRLSVHTNQPCVVLYSHNYPNSERLRYGVLGQQHDSLCIETQKNPNLKSHQGGHAAALYPGNLYLSRTKFIFDVVT